MSFSASDIDSDSTVDADFQVQGPIMNVFTEDVADTTMRKSTRQRSLQNPPKVAPPPAPPAPKAPKPVLASTARGNIPLKRLRSLPDTKESNPAPAKRSRPSLARGFGTTSDNLPLNGVPQSLLSKNSIAMTATHPTDAPAMEDNLPAKRPAATKGRKSAASRSASHSSTSSAADKNFIAKLVPAKPNPPTDPKQPTPPLERHSRSNSAAKQRTARNSAPPRRPSWADPNSDKFDVIAFLKADEYAIPDPLAELPPTNFTYLDSQGRLRNPYKYAKDPVAKKPSLPEHPRLTYHRRNGTATAMLRQYYHGMPKNRVLPLAGIIRDPDPRDFIQQPGDFVVRGPEKEESAPGTMFPNLKDIKDSILTDNDLQQEDNFYLRPSIKLVIPDHIKAILVDDWENVTKNQQLVPLPADYTVEKILDDYIEFEAPKRVRGSAQADILEEVVAGLKEYFEKCLGRILLYRFERAQYSEARESWASKTGDLAGKNAISTYGAEHFCRLLVSLPELIAQTNMDTQSVTRLREELSKLTNWLGKEANMPKYFVKEYETPSQAYVDKARIG